MDQGRRAGDGSRLQRAGRREERRRLCRARRRSRGCMERSQRLAPVGRNGVRHPAGPGIDARILRRGACGGWIDPARHR